MSDWKHQQIGVGVERCPTDDDNPSRDTIYRMRCEQRWSPNEARRMAGIGEPLSPAEIEAIKTRFRTERLDIGAWPTT